MMSKNNADFVFLLFYLKYMLQKKSDGFQWMLILFRNIENIQSHPTSNMRIDFPFSARGILQQTL